MSVLFYALAWVVFACLHSLLARPSIQKWFESILGSAYRITYNLFASLKLSVVLWLGRQLLSDSRFSMLDYQMVGVVSVGVEVLGVVVLLAALAHYDIGRFSGITQLFTGERVSAISSEVLQREGLNRWMRHPLYTGAFLILWGGAVSSYAFWTATLASVYLLVGTVFEERKLIDNYGDDYRRYQREVPRYFPSWLTKKTDR